MLIYSLDKGFHKGYKPFVPVQERGGGKMTTTKKATDRLNIACLLSYTLKDKLTENYGNFVNIKTVLSIRVTFFSFNFFIAKLL